MKIQLIVSEPHAVDAFRILSDVSDASIQRKNGKSFFTVDRKALTKDMISKMAILFPEFEMLEIGPRSARKVPVTLPDLLVGVMNCPNPLCVTSQPKEPAVPEIRVISVHPLLLRCEYCGRYVPEESITLSLMNVSKSIPPLKKIRAKV